MEVIDERRTRAGDGRQIMRRRAAKSPNKRAKSHAGEPSNPIDVKNEDRSGNVYENKGPGDNLPDSNDDISAWLEVILRKRTRIFQKPSAFCCYLSAGERTPRFEMERHEPLLHRQYFRNLLALAHDVIIRPSVWPAWG